MVRTNATVPQLNSAECFHELRGMEHGDHIQCFPGTDLDLRPQAGAETTPACCGGIGRFDMDGMDLTARKLDSLATEDAIKAIGNNQHSPIGHGDLDADLAVTFEKVAAALIPKALIVRHTRIRKPEAHGHSLNPDPPCRFLASLF